MSTEAATAPLASFEAKWAEAYPEFALALRFDRDAGHAARSAFACLVFELEHAAFGIREAQPAAIKLQWWAEEFVRAGKGEARHPLTQALGARIVAATIPTAHWHRVIVGALAQRDPEPAANNAALLDGYASLYTPIATIEAALFGTHADAIARALTLTRTLREGAGLATALRDGKLPLPLDLLARHRLARGDLAAVSDARSQALRDAFGGFGSELRKLVEGRALAERPLGVVRATMAAADARRAVQAARASEPLAAMNAALARLSIPVVWSAWRAARRSRA